MSKAVMISIQPKWCELIASGKKTIEVRKTKPKIDTPFKCYIYMTMNGLSSMIGVKTKQGFVMKETHEVYPTMANGRVIGEFVCNYIDECIPDYNPITQKFFNYDFWDKMGNRLEDCLSDEEKAEYGKGKPLYGLQISQLKIYDKPKDIREFKKPCISPKYPYCPCCPVGTEYIRESEQESYRVFGECSTEWVCLNWLKKPPQSWCYVEELED